MRIMTCYQMREVKVSQNSQIKPKQKVKRHFRGDQQSQGITLCGFVTISDPFHILSSNFIKCYYTNID